MSRKGIDVEISALRINAYLDRIAELEAEVERLTKINQGWISDWESIALAAGEKPDVMATSLRGRIVNMRRKKSVPICDCTRCPCGIRVKRQGQVCSGCADGSRCKALNAIPYPHSTEDAAPKAENAELREAVRKLAEAAAKLLPSAHDIEHIRREPHDCFSSGLVALWDALSLHSVRAVMEEQT